MHLHLSVGCFHHPRVAATRTMVMTGAIGPTKNNSAPLRSQNHLTSERTPFQCIFSTATISLLLDEWRRHPTRLVLHTPSRGAIREPARDPRKPRWGRPRQPTRSCRVLGAILSEVSLDSSATKKYNDKADAPRSTLTIHANVSVHTELSRFEPGAVALHSRCPSVRETPRKAAMPRARAHPRRLEAF